MDYTPWHPLENVAVQALVNECPYLIVLPIVYGRDERAAAVTAQIVASLSLEKLSQIARARSGHTSLDPGLHKMECPVCGWSWDAWVSEEGSLEDPRDAFCANSECSHQGQPARLLE